MPCFWLSLRFVCAVPFTRPHDKLLAYMNQQLCSSHLCEWQHANPGLDASLKAETHVLLQQQLHAVRDLTPHINKQLCCAPASGCVWRIGHILIEEDVLAVQFASMLYVHVARAGNSMSGAANFASGCAQDCPRYSWPVWLVLLDHAFAYCTCCASLTRVNQRASSAQRNAVRRQ
jgi:hypothetical protein